MATWQKLIAEAMQEHGETFEDVVCSTLRPEQITEAFYDGYGVEQGCQFTLWTRNRVYFPACYGGDEWVASVSRNPDGKPTRHIGGG